MANLMDERYSDAGAIYPKLRQFDPLSEDIPQCEEILANLQNSICSKDESYKESLYFGVEPPKDSQPSEANVADKPPISMQIVPFATGSEKEKTLSVTAEDLQMLLHDHQASPNLLRSLAGTENLGSKSQYGSDGNRRRSEAWFTLPCPAKGDLVIDKVDKSVVWFDYLEDTHQTRFLLFRLPPDLLGKIRRLEEESGQRFQHGYELVLFLLERTLSAWFRQLPAVEFLILILMIQAGDSHRLTDAKFDAMLTNADTYLSCLCDYISALESLMTLTDFLKGYMETFSIFEDRCHRNIFGEHLQVRRHQIRLLTSGFGKHKERVQILKTTALHRGISKRTRTQMTAKGTLDNSSAGPQDKNGAKVEVPSRAGEEIKNMKMIVVVLILYLPWICVASVFNVLSFPGDERGNISWRIRLYLGVTGVLTSLTLTAWLVYQHGIPLRSTTQRAFSFIRRSPETNSEGVAAVDNSARAQADAQSPVEGLSEENTALAEKFDVYRAKYEAQEAQREAGQAVDSTEEQELKQLFQDLIQTLVSAGSDPRNSEELL